MRPLCDKNVLFICPAFRKYDEAIANKLRELGATVFHFGTNPRGIFYDIIMSSNQARNRLRVLLDKYRSVYFKHIIRTISKEKFDYVLVIKGDTFPTWFLKKLREMNSNAKFVLYQWDSMKAYYYVTKSDFIKFKDIYNEIYSFDPIDCKNIKELKYRPLFYLDVYAETKGENPEKLDYDLYFAGGGAQDRLTILNQIVENSPDLKIKFYLKILFYSKYIKYLIKSKPGFKFFLGNISHKEIIGEMIRSRAVIDVPSDYQDGLTIRTFEALALGRKLVTTNHNIRNEPFYNPNNILIIEKNNPVLLKDFLNIPFVPVDLTKYSLESFLLEMIQN
jgi:hypothetical protein